MLSLAQPVVTPSAVFATMCRYWCRWMVPAVIISAGAATYGFLKAPTWEASQAVTVRNEAASTWNAPGKFRHDNEMKTLEETLLEIVMSRGVLVSALSQVGLPEDWAPAEPSTAWPNEEAVENLRRGVTLAAPKGAEFGKTEVFYLKVKDSSRTRAIELAATLFADLDRGLAQLRDGRIRGTVEELRESVGLAQAELDSANNRLLEMEQEVGGDLVELRLLHQAAAGNSDLQRTFVDAQNELRQAQQAHATATDLLAIVEAAQKNPKLLLAAPNALLESQPAVKRLKDGLSEAQLRTATLLSMMTETHPQLVASRKAEEGIHLKIVLELANAVRGIEAECGLAASRIELLQNRLSEMRQQRDRLAQLRVEYTNMTSDVEHRRKLLEESERNFAEATANQRAAQSVSLITAIGQPDTGSRPVGLSPPMIALAGACGGLLAGWGLLFLTVPLPPAMQYMRLETSLPLHDDNAERPAEDDSSPLTKVPKKARLRVTESSILRS